MSGLTDALIDDILRDAPGHVSGTRPIHAPGAAATGWFTPSEVAAAYCVAAPFGTGRTPVAVRFSDGVGEPSAPAQPPVVRGMAVRFGAGEECLDLISMSVSTFFARDVDEFRAFCAAAVPAPVTRLAQLRQLLRQATFALTPPPPPKGARTSSAAGVFDFARNHPDAAPTVTAAGVVCNPDSYTTLDYHAVHAYRLRGADGRERWVRFHWEPVGGVRPTDRQDLRLDAALASALGTAQASFVLRAQVGEAGDDPSDPTRPWPGTRRRIVLGTLWLDAAPGDDPTGEDWTFNPGNVVDGIAPCPEDRIFAVRSSVYARSAARRRIERAASPHPQPTKTAKEPRGAR